MLYARSSFFYIRLLRNPAFYVKSLGAAFKVKEGPARALELFVKDAFKSLNEAGLVENEEGDDAVLSTGLGEVMSKRYIRASHPASRSSPSRARSGADRSALTLQASAR